VLDVGQMERRWRRRIYIEHKNPKFKNIELKMLNYNKMTEGQKEENKVRKVFI